MEIQKRWKGGQICMVCQRCNSAVPNTAGLSTCTAITGKEWWCRACFTKAGGKWPEVLTIGSDIEARLAQERVAKIEAHQRFVQQRKRSEKLKQRKKVKKFTKARKKAVLLINRALRT
jgi:hypothetical protein